VRGGRGAAAQGRGRAAGARRRQAGGGRGGGLLERRRRVRRRRRAAVRGGAALLKPWASASHRTLGGSLQAQPLDIGMPSGGSAALPVHLAALPLAARAFRPREPPAVAIVGVSRGQVDFWLVPSLHTAELLEPLWLYLGPT
jgi:hypothetical protein